jgi:hypothetical protein
MRTSKDLTDVELVVAMDIKRAMKALTNGNDIQTAKNHLYSALASLYH